MSILRNKQNRLRMIWRMMVYVLLGIVVFLPFIPVLKVLPLDSGESGPASIVNLVFVFFLNISFVAACCITYKWIDRRPSAMLGLNFWSSSCKELFIGMGLGFCNGGLILIVLLI